MKKESRTSSRTTAKQNLQTSIRRKFLLCTGLFVSFLIIGGLITFVWFHNRSVVDDSYPETHREIRKSLIEQISNFDSSFTDETETTSAPYVPNSGHRTQSQQVDRQLNSSVFTRDYSVVSVEPGMQKESVFDTVDIVKATVDSELEWLHSPRAVEGVLAQGKQVAREWVYGWLQVGTPVDASRVTRELTQVDAEVIGRQGALLRVKLPKDRDSLVSIQGLSWVSGLGVLPPAAKIAQDLSAIVAASSSTTEHPLFITVMSDDEENFRRELSERGVKVGHFYADIRTFAGVSQGGDIEDLSRLDFVQAIEPIRIVKKQHDSAVQSMGVDAVRGLGQAVGEYTGFSGKSVGVAVMDSGLNTNHISISSLRESICGRNFVPNEEVDLWFDEGYHGTHVTGTVVGNGYFQPKMAGMAPGVEHIRFAKVLTVRGFGFDEWVNRGIDYLGSPISCSSNQWSDDAVKPLIVNMSLGGGSLYFDGKDTNARKVDSTVWSERQLYVVAAGNLAMTGYSDYAAAKNSLAIGASHDTGDLVHFSSYGPTYDGRLLPNVVGTGVNVWSTEGGGQYETYYNLSGTSMSSPAVAGVSALLMDASPGYREHPALARARLMAGAVKPDVWLESEDHFPRDNTDGPGSFQAGYGMGFVSARVAILNDDVAEGWFSSGTTVEVEHKEVAYHDIEVPAGASRLDVVLTWDEPSAETIAGTVLNDLDLWVDYAADCGTGSCGENSSLSGIDNVEWVIIDDPEPGTYRLKVSGSRVYTELRAGLAWTVIRGDSTPRLTIAAAQESYEIENGESAHEHTVELLLSSSGYVSVGTELYVDCRTQSGSPCESFKSRGHFDERSFSGSSDREDGLTIDSAKTGTFHLGEIAYGEEQKVRLHLYSESEENLVVSFTASSWNGHSGTTSVNFLIVDKDADDLEVPESPLNDEFATPLVLEDTEGVLDIDTLLASTEGGEAGLAIGQPRPLRSLWYSWEAQSDDLATFVVSPSLRLSGQYLSDFRPHLEVFEYDGEGSGLSSVARVGGAPWSAQWFPLVGQEYRLRVSQSHGSMPLRLRWLRGKQATNDNFADAIVLTGESGTIDGNNLGATLEEGEEYGYLAASVWYRWEAPEDGRWEFQIKDAQVVLLLVFKGDDIGNLRLVSGVLPEGQKVPVTVKEGELYYLMVAAQTAESGGWIFDELTWEKSDQSPENEDYFSHALQIDETESGTIEFRSEKQYSVEPDEPEQTGIQTAWMQWKAPSDGQFTWFWNDGNHQVKMFQGDTVDTLELVTPHENVSGVREFVVDINKDEQYFLSIGTDFKNILAFDVRNIWNRGYNHRIEWGLTPENNSMGGAISLNGTEGSIEGYTRFATTEPNGLEKYGFSTLWYAFEAEESGWYQFRLSDGGSNYRLSAFREAKSSSDLVYLGDSGKSLLLDRDNQVIIYLEKGEIGFIRVGNLNEHQNSRFTLQWEPTSPPQWLKYLGRLHNGFRDAANNVLTIKNPQHLTFDHTGKYLFVSTSSGVQIFERNQSNGLLSYLDELSDIPGSVDLEWDPFRRRLCINKFAQWWVYKVQSDTDPFELELDYTFDDGTDQNLPNWDGDPVLFMDSNGDYLYKSKTYFQQAFRFDDSGNLELIGRASFGGVVFGGERIVGPFAQQSHWLVSDAGEIYVTRRELGSSVYRRVSALQPHTFGYDIVAPAVVDSSEFFLARAHPNSNWEISVNSADVSKSALHLMDIESFDPIDTHNCHTMIPRPGVTAVDVICSSALYVAEYVEELGGGEIKIQDLIINRYNKKIPDVFGSYPPEFSLHPWLSTTESPDRKHLYVSTVASGILMFERIGVDLVEIPAAEDWILRLDPLSVSDNRVEFGSESAEDGCLTVANITIDDVSYTLEDSKWQERDLGTSWVDIQGSEEAEQVCSRKLEETKEYRVVVTMAVDGTSGTYASNFMGRVFYERLDELEVSSTQIDLAALTISSCQGVSDLTLNGTKYTVETSQWQVRNDSEDDWEDIESTRKSRELCTYSPQDDREYRLVGTFLIDDVRGYYHSNIISN